MASLKSAIPAHEQPTARMCGWVRLSFAVLATATIVIATMGSVIVEIGWDISVSTHVIDAGLLDSEARLRRALGPLDRARRLVMDHTSPRSRIVLLDGVGVQERNHLQTLRSLVFPRQVDHIERVRKNLGSLWAEGMTYFLDLGHGSFERFTRLGTAIASDDRVQLIRIGEH